MFAVHPEVRGSAMTIRPRVLVIDDVYGASTTSGLSRQLRHLYCDAFGLRDEHDDAMPQGTFVADAVFCRGQLDAAPHDNSMDVVDVAFRSGWPDREGRYWSAVLVDMQFGDDNRFGLKVIEHIHRISGDVPTIVVSSQDQLQVHSGETLRDAAERFGAQDFLAAPGVDGSVEPAYRSTPQNLQERLRVLGLLPDPLQRVVGTSLAICRTLRAIRRQIPVDVVGQILLLGPAGSGKSHLVDYIHREIAQRQRRSQADVPSFVVPLGGVGEDMQKKALFGTTAATDVKPGPGAFENARDGGLVFLDEIGQLAPGAQGDLLVPLQVVRSTAGGDCRLLTRMGSAEPIEARCFVSAATNLDLDSLVRAGLFSEALLQRFDGKRVVLPSLLERRSDIPLLVRHFVDRTCRRYGLITPPRVDVSVTAWEKYASEHSVRQMENLIESTLSANPFKKSLTEKDFAIDAHDSPTTKATVSEVGEQSSSDEVSLLRANLAKAEQKIAELTRHRNATDTGSRVSALIELLSGWTPAPDLSTEEFDGAFNRLESAFGVVKLRLWRELLARQKELTGKATLMATAKRLLGRDDIHKSRPGDLANQVFNEAGVGQRPSDPILAEIWDKRRVAKK